MDPVNAVGIAAAVVQFADYGFRLIKSAYELYKSPSGQCSEYIEVSVVSQDLSGFADAIRSKLDESHGPVGEIFIRLYRECKSTNDKLQSILDKLKVQGSTKIELAADGLRVAFRQVATADDIEKLTNRLSQIREQMNVGLLYLLLDEAGKNGVELRQFAKQQADMIATLDRIDGTTKQFSADIIGVIDKWPENNLKETEKMVHYVLSDKWKASKYAEQTVFDATKDNEKLEKIHQSLYFESISHRETSIPKRHVATLEWIFHEPRASEDGRALWSDFLLWLRGESPDIYWITGKPGAGKSTLVKFISQDSRFRVLLQEWAAESQLIIIRFFFWTSGMNRLQKSQEGLFRTLLFEAIQQRPQLVIDIFPARWFLLQSFDGQIKLPSLAMDELRVGFRNLLSATGDNLKVALLIDGLDEFDESHGENHRDLIRLLREVNAQAGVKICASSRPWNIFRDEYRKNPMLQLEKLTRDDIKNFVQEQLQLSPGYSEVAAINPEAAHKIIIDIVDKSQGVFLWVSVISGLLRTALQEGTSISDLQATIDDVPNEVADLFRYIWNRTSERFRVEASQYLQLMRICQQHEINLLALILWFGDKEFPVDFDTASVTSTYLRGAIKSLERRLMSRTGGLLELVSSSNGYKENPKDVCVGYMHRTANDWANDNWVSITSATELGFDPFFWFIKGHALNIVLTTKLHEGNLTELTDWLSVYRIIPLISEDHPDEDILVTALDRLDNHTVGHMPKGRSPSGIMRVNELKSSSEGHFAHIHMGLTERFGPMTLPCTNVLEFSARVPIPVYLKHRSKVKSNLCSTADYYVRILDNLIFGEFWSYNINARLEIMDFLVQTYQPPEESLCTVRDKVKYAQSIFSEEYPTNHRIYTYFTQVIYALGAQPTQIASQPDQNGATSGGSRVGLSRTPPVASDPLYQIPKPKFRDELRSFSRKLFSRK